MKPNSMRRHVVYSAAQIAISNSAEWCCQFVNTTQPFQGLPSSIIRMTT